MWGNKQGWVISVIIAGVMGWITLVGIAGTAVAIAMQR